MNAMVAGKVDYMCDQVVTVVPQALAGSIRIYAVATPTRNPALPDTPTAKEAGLPQFAASAWNALFAPKSTPQPIIAKLNAALVKALDDEVVRNRSVRRRHTDHHNVRRRRYRLVTREVSVVVHPSQSTK